MRVRFRSFSSLALSVTVVGCSIHPLPKNVTRDTTLSIIEKVRCETRDALVERMMLVLEEEHSQTNLTLLQKLKKPFGASAQAICDLDPLEFDKNARDRLNRFSSSSITYAFKFTIEENKVKTGVAKFTMPFTKGSFSLGLSAGSDKKRKNVRTVSLGDTFSNLIVGRYASGKPTQLDCDFVDQPRKHWIYPITGKIGMAEVVDTYIDLSKISKKITTFNDVLTFTTVLNAGVDPKVTLSSLVPKKLRLTEASGSYKAARTDAHEVGLTLTTPEKAKPKKYIKMIHTITGGTPSEKIPEIGVAVTKLFECKNAPPICSAGTEAVCEIPEGTYLDPDWTCKNIEPPIYKKCNIFKKIPKLVPMPTTVTMGGQSRKTTRMMPTDKMVDGPFAVSVEQEERSLSQGLAESRRQDSLDTNRELLDLIGK